MLIIVRGFPPIGQNGLSKTFIYLLLEGAVKKHQKMALFAFLMSRCIFCPLSYYRGSSTSMASFIREFELGILQLSPSLVCFQ